MSRWTLAPGRARARADARVLHTRSCPRAERWGFSRQLPYRCWCTSAKAAKRQTPGRARGRGLVVSRRQAVSGARPSPRSVAPQPPSPASASGASAASGPASELLPAPPLPPPAAPLLPELPLAPPPPEPASALEPAVPPDPADVPPEPALPPDPAVPTGIVTSLSSPQAAMRAAASPRTSAVRQVKAINFIPPSIERQATIANRTSLAPCDGDDAQLLQRRCAQPFQHWNSWRAAWRPVGESLYPCKTAASSPGVGQRRMVPSPLTRRRVRPGVAGQEQRVRGNGSANPHSCRTQMKPVGAESRSSSCAGDVPLQVDVGLIQTAE
jgi:hypothetical protein